MGTSAEWQRVTRSPGRIGQTLNAKGSMLVQPGARRQYPETRTGFHNPSKGTSQNLVRLSRAGPVDGRVYLQLNRDVNHSL